MNDEKGNDYWQLFDKPGGLFSTRRRQSLRRAGQITESTLGNGLKRVTGYDDYHQPNQIALKNGSTFVDRVDYSFDPYTGNLMQRNDITNGRNEAFDYDNLHRLESVCLNNGAANQTSYYPNGNIHTKFDVGAYQYAHNNHAVSGISNKAASYSPQSISLVNTSYNRVSNLILFGSQVNELDLEYGPDKQRRSSRYYADGVLQKTMIYAENYEKETVSGGSAKEYDYICSPEGLSAIAVKTNGARSLYYVHTDHLGSIRVVTNASKGIQSRCYYDAWGKRTLLAGTAITSRGYTGHEHLTDFGLINMNARLYDPALGRFIAMDPFVQTPDFSQNFNRYSYALNNPLKYTDPSGELFVIDDLIAAIAIGAIINTWINIATNNINSGGDFVMSVGIGGLSGAAGGAAAYGINGAISVAGAIPNALATGAAQAGLGAAIGFGQNGLNNVVAGNSFIDGWQQAVIGGAIGGFVSGAVSGGIKGYNIAKYAGKNVWWGNQVKYGRTQYSFFTSEKPYATVKFPIKFTPDGNNTCVVQSLAEFEKAMGGSRTMEDFISSTGYSEKGVCLGTVGADGCEYTYQNISDFLSGQGFKNNSSLTLAQMQNSVLMQSESLSGSNVGIAYTDPKLGGHVTSVKTIKYFQDFVKIYGRGQTYILNKLEQWNPFYFLISK